MYQLVLPLCKVTDCRHHSIHRVLAVLQYSQNEGTSRAAPGKVVRTCAHLVRAMQLAGSAVPHTTRHDDKKGIGDSKHCHELHERSYFTPWHYVLWTAEEKTKINQLLQLHLLFTVYRWYTGHKPNYFEQSCLILHLHCSSS